MKHILLIVSLVLTACGHANTNIPVQKSDDGLNHALNFINAYIENDSGDILKWINSNDMTTSRFKSELKKILDEADKRDPEIGLGFDPILDAQDIDDAGFELDHFDNETKCFILKGKELKDFKVVIRVIKENNKWFVDGCGIVNLPDSLRNKN